MDNTEQVTLEQAKEHLQQIKEYMEIQEYADDFYYSSGRHEADRRELIYWENKVKELSPDTSK